MFKALLFCAFVAVALCANPTWDGTWYVVNHSSTLTSICNVPMNGTMVNISSPDNGTISIDGEGAFDKQHDSWLLQWSADEQTAGFCTSSWCANGTLTTEKGITYASVVWSIQDAANTTCNVLMTPLAENWLGRWLVVLSGTNSLFECDPPKGQSIVNISQTADDKKLLMTGNDLSSGNDYTWDLLWNANDLSPTNACTGVLCASGNLTIIKWVMESKIVWNVGSAYECYATLVRLPPIPVVEEMTLISDESDFESSEPVRVHSVHHSLLDGYRNSQRLMGRNLLNRNLRRD